MEAPQRSSALFVDFPAQVLTQVFQLASRQRASDRDVWKAGASALRMPILTLSALQALLRI